MNEGVTISWVDLEVKAPLSRTEKNHMKKRGVAPEPKTIIHKMSGSIRPGELTAIMGPSGCGKTTFMNFLAKRKYFLRSLMISGNAYMNGNDINDIDFNSATGYVMQDDVVLPIYTVREVLEFTAQLRLKPDKWKGQVDKVIRDLALQACENTIIGNEMDKGISGGEKKRTSIAIEMLTNPIVLFLDEPTTGLDSHSSEKLIDLLNELAASLHMTIVTVIHQPNSFTYSKFQNLILMGGGRIFYNGPGAAAAEYFSRIGHKCPKFSNPAEFLLELVTPSPHDPEKLNNLYAQIEQSPAPPIQKTNLPSFEERHFSNFWKQLWLLGKKVGLNIVRNKLLFYFKASAHLFFALLTVMCFYQVAGDNEDDVSVFDRAGTMLFIIVLIAFISINAAAAYADEKAMFIREQASQTYGPGPYYLSKLIFETPPNLLMSIVLAILAYLAIGLSLENPEQIFIFTFICFLTNLAALGWGNFLIISIPITDAAVAAAPFVLVVQFLMSGLLINYDEIPVYLIWLEYTSLFKYAWSAAMINEFDTFDQSNCGTAKICDAVEYYSIEISLWDNILFLFVLTAAIHLVAFLTVFRLSRKLRG